MSMFDDPKWVRSVEDLKRKASEFMGLYNEAIASTPQTPELANTRERVLDKSRAIKATIEDVTSQIDWAYAKWQEYFGDESDGTLQNLGLLPLIPVAVIGGAVAGVVYGIKQLKDYLTENQRIRMLRAEGYSAQQAVEIARQQSGGIGPSIERGLKSFGPWIAIGFLGFMFMRKRGIL